MTEKKLDCVILGLLAHEELTGYEIKRRIDRSLSYFWGASYGSIYPTLESLVKNGFAEKHSDEDSARNRQIYSVTPEGRERLKEWLSEPVQRDELRSETLLKLFFGNEAGEGQTAGHIRAFREKTESSLAELYTAEKNLSACLDDDRAHGYYLMTVQFGIRTYEAWIKYCDEMLDRLGEG
ncbi:MAG: PadR family transcriptional regulator [Oscillospiraceae bacterium]|nr:PadR family transcriptional regulator [Oscillospiraceae bacterium]